MIQQKREDLFAATPPLEALRLILSLAASQEGAAEKKKLDERLKKKDKYSER